MYTTMRMSMGWILATAVALAAPSRAQLTPPPDSQFRFLLCGDGTVSSDPVNDGVPSDHRDIVGYTDTATGHSANPVYHSSLPEIAAFTKP